MQRCNRTIENGFVEIWKYERLVLVHFVPSKYGGKMECLQIFVVFAVIRGGFRFSARSPIQRYLAQVSQILKSHSNTSLYPKSRLNNILSIKS